MKSLIIGDAGEVVETLAPLLSIRWRDCRVVSTSLGAEAIRLVETETPDIIFLDPALPDHNGLDVLRAIRSFSDTPIIVVTADQNEVNKVKALELGADDYIVKPFSHTELLARVKAVLRRAQMSPLRDGDDTLVVAGLTIDYAEPRVVVDGGQERFLTQTEWHLLSYLSRNRGHIIPYPSLTEEVWGSQYVTRAAVKAAVHRLRQKLNDSGRVPRFIRSHPGMGYSFTGSD